jgi:beta-glucosidase
VAWEKIPLGAGESKTVTLRLDPKFLSIFNEQKDDWELLAGEYRFFVGGSFRETPLTGAVKR